MTDHLRGTVVRTPYLHRLWGREAGRWYAHRCDANGKDEGPLLDLGPRPELDAKADDVDRRCGSRRAGA